MNSGDRLLALTAAFRGASQTQSMHDAWVHIFELSGHNVDEEAAGAIQVALAEVRLWAKQLSELGVPTDLYQFAGNQLRKALSSGAAAQAVQNAMPTVWSDPVQHVLRWSVLVLRQRFEEAEIESGDLRALQDALDVLETQISVGDLPNSVRGALERQADSIRMALRLYKLGGVESLKEAMRSAAGDLVMVDKADSSTPAAKPAMRASFDLLSKVHEVCQKVSPVLETGEKAITIGKEFAKLLGYAT